MKEASKFKGSLRNVLDAHLIFLCHLVYLVPWKNNGEEMVLVLECKIWRVFFVCVCMCQGIKMVVFRV